jgi:hypothetical protein
MWFALEYNNLLIYVTMAIDMLDFMTMVIRFYMESGIAKFSIDIHIMKKNVFCNWPCNSLYLYAMNVNGKIA